MYYKLVAQVYGGGCRMLDINNSWACIKGVTIAAVRRNQQMCLGETEIFLDSNNRYAVALEGDPPPELLTFFTLEAAVAAALTLHGGTK